jgi:hypothetical protein
MHCLKVGLSKIDFLLPRSGLSSRVVSEKEAIEETQTNDIK